MNRRDALHAVVAGLLVGFWGCSRGSTPGQQGPAAGDKPAMVVHRDPGCGCCEQWAQRAASAGYQVKLVDEPDMAAVKARLGVPEALAACHTATVSGAVVEGHVPFAALATFLAHPPSAAIGLAVAGMPVGSPGMEVPGQPAERLVVHAFDARGRSSVYLG